MGQSTWIVPVLIDIINYCETNNRSDVAETLAEALKKIAPTLADGSACDDLFQEDRSDVLHFAGNVLAFPSRARLMSDRMEKEHAPGHQFRTSLFDDFVAF